MAGILSRWRAGEVRSNAKVFEMKSLAAKSRSRARLGADTARVWAREIRLGNPYAKSILLALANYMNEDGSAFPGIETLARDTDISEDTVVNRLRWMEGIGAIALFKCWVDEHGRRNYDGRGRVTSSEVRFLFDADIEAIEAAAKGAAKPTVLRGAAAQSHAAKAEISPRPCRELNDTPQEGFSPGLAPDQPPPTSPRTEEELTDSPQSPPLPDSEDEKTEPINTGTPYENFLEVYGEGSVRPERAKSLWSALTEAERETAIRGARGYRSQRLSTKKMMIDPERFLRNRELWMEFAGKPIAAEISFVEPASDDGRSAAGLLAMAGAVRPFETSHQGKNVFALRFSITPQMRALARYFDERGQPVDGRQWWDVGGQAAGAWKEFMVGSVGRPPLQKPGGVIRVPRPWPPRIDGSWAGEAPPNSAISKTG